MFDIQCDRTGISDRKDERDPKKCAKEIIAKLDISGDKKLSKEEFITGYVLIQLNLYNGSIHSFLDAKMIQLFGIYWLLMHKYPSKLPIFSFFFLMI